MAVQLRRCRGDKHHLQQPGALGDMHHVRWAASRCPPTRDAGPHAVLMPKGPVQKGSPR